MAFKTVLDMLSRYFQSPSLGSLISFMHFAFKKFVQHCFQGPCSYKYISGCVKLPKSHLHSCETDKTKRKLHEIRKWPILYPVQITFWPIL